MSYTNIDLVRRHIGLSEKSAQEYRDIPLVFAGSSEIALPGGGIVKGSAAVKRVMGTNPVYNEIEVSTEPITLANQRVTPGSVTVASDSSLGRVFTIGVDYSIAYESGVFSVIPGGSIESGDNIAIWYYFYTLYEEGSDYSLDYDRATIRRLAGGEIVEGQSLLIDYDTPYQYQSYAMLEEAVTEANAVIEKEVDPNRMFGADLTLQTAATYLAAAILCRAAASEDLRVSENPGRSVTSWLTLAENFRNDYERLIKIFRPGRTRMSGPRNT